ncbi:endonuclease domain-containing protein [Leptolyngbya sp. NK1-12]|uniref:Endonuclease domain-containing protein n=1 Tax=Leptolyngbya sp. NK1-12 TaxID=2547451 RepID=A0AA96WU38_9CYAN|nr:endonuclease domain-containing protein [Leptolyngbya sp. NK1-12]
MASQRIRGTTPNLIAAARQLRLNLTPAEKILWEALRRRQLRGWKFRCQHPVASFIVDFYCPQYRLIIELDGAIHDQQIEYDASRTEQLHHLGYRVIRFRNQEVLSDLSGVLQTIVNEIEKLTSQSPPQVGDLGG